MSYAIFDSAGAANRYIHAVDVALGYPKAGAPAQPFPAGWTLTHAAPRAHPTGAPFAVLVAGDVFPDEALEVVPELDGTWEVAP